MANEMYTLKSGRQIPVEPVTIPADVMTTVYALWERLKPTKEYSKSFVVLKALLLGCRMIQKRMDRAEVVADAKELAAQKARVAAQVKRDLNDGKTIDPRMVLAQLGIVIPKQEHEAEHDEPDSQATDALLEADADDLTDEQLEMATSPNGNN